MKVLIYAYREWALNVANKLCELEEINIDIKVRDDNYSAIRGKNYDLIILIGWSDILPAELVSKHEIFGVHPSDLPNYSGGSPIQNQINDGIISTHNTIFQLNEKLDEGLIWLKYPLSLKGNNIKEIFRNIEISSYELVKRFIRNKNSLKPTSQPKHTKKYKRRTFEDGKIISESFNVEELLKIYNQIRCLGEPYPSAYIEDSDGNRLFFDKVRYVEKDNDDTSC